jgi:hypothetical protein
LLVTAGEVKMYIDSNTVSKVKSTLIQKYGDSQKIRIEKGVDQVASLWKAEDGSIEEFVKFCDENFLGDEAMLLDNFKRLEHKYEILYGYLKKIGLEFKRPIDLDWGEILPIDMMFGSYDLESNLDNDFFKNKIAFYVILNFPYYNLDEKIANSTKWTRKDWAYARMGDTYIARIPADINQISFSARTMADAYISDYNIYMGKLIDAKGKTYFPKNLKLISHWGIRDELKSRYKDPEGLKKQEMIFKVMQRIITQEIPEIIVNSDKYEWNPFSNKVFQNGVEIKAEPELTRRYQEFLNIFKAEKLIDQYSPNLPTLMRRQFEMARGIPEKEVEKMFTDFMTSKIIPKIARIVEKKLDRDLRPFDIWFTGFRTGESVNEEELDKLVAAKYPTIEAFQKDLPNILVQVGLSKEQAEFVAPKVLVEPSRGAGHASEALTKDEPSVLRSRIPKNGMNYKGYNIAMHELGHCTEETFSLHKVDYYSLHGIPNTAFTEAFAYAFQDQSIALLGIKEENANAKYYKALDTAWWSYEIMGVSLVDMKVWNWLYQNPEATAKDLKDAVIRISKEVWNKYYADIFGIKDQIILGVYSHMIDSGLYLPDYALGHLIEFQVYSYLQGKNLGKEMERMCSIGSVIPNLWMQKAVGNNVDIQPLLKAAEEAIKYVK